MTVKETAEYLRIPLPTVYYLVQRGQLPAIQIGGRWRVKKDALDRDVLRESEQGQPTVLVVDDDEGIQAMFKLFLKKTGFSRLVVGTGKEALAALQKQKFDLCFLDLQLPDISGDDMLKALGQIPLAHQPGTFWEYSIAVDVLGLLLERVTKQPLDQLLSEMLLTPLGMRDTTFWVDPSKVARLAETLDADAQKAPMLKSYRQFTKPDGRNYLKGGAGLVGTAEDYLKFTQMIVNGGEYQGKRYLSKKTVEFMLADHTAGMGGTTIASTGPGYGFGLGFATRLQDGMAWVPGSKGDAMWAGAWGTSFWIDPKEGLVGILMSQGPSTRVHSRMLFKNLVYGAMVK